MKPTSHLRALGRNGSMLVAAQWGADWDVILPGVPWQTWRAPSWAEIKALEKLEATVPSNHRPEK